MKRKLFPIMVLLVLVFGMSSGSFAGTIEEESNDNVIAIEKNFSGDNGQRSEGAIDVSGITIEDDDLSDLIQVIETSTLTTEAKIKALENVSGLNSVISSIPSSKFLNVWVSTQTQSYWCGPATAKQLVTYFNGSSDPQATIASDMGTTTAGSDMAQIRNYVNNKTGVYYNIYSNPSLSYLTSCIKASITANMPPVLRMKVSTSYGFPYSISSSGHFMNANGYDSSSVRVTDPEIKNRNASSYPDGWYYVSWSNVYDATNNHFAKELGAY
ncbi:MAG: C39 family peptidase [Oscillospiraceae bacterium]|nr:C39 family peptidase [Oscillospiraceae bacterium]